ncbi:regulatory factor X 4-like isoform X2 [Watersipora subatra]|uniref:regulatory factor X 4-like isoform X2 n=1 Tax=Watersipora subatra TaxID=2589382 RepID=UPI00355C87D2
MAMDPGLGQQTYGHPHQMSTGWMPSHMAGIDPNGAMTQSHGMYAMGHQPLPQMYYDMDSTIHAPPHSAEHQHISEHQSSMPSQQGQAMVSSQQAQQLGAQDTSSGNTDAVHHGKQCSPAPVGSPSSLDPNDSLSGSKTHSTPMTLKWLNDNYEVAEGVCIPRSTLYQHYIEFCENRELNPVNAASFGKIIRQQFPQITTRRLGTRGQSKYHYYGIGVKEQSPYYDYVYSKAGLQSSTTAKKEAPKQMPVQAYSPRSKIGTLLPEFPDIEELKLPKDIEAEKLLTFIMMYRTHCQRILDTVIRANFDEVQNFLLHFWQGMPSHMTAILSASQIVGMVAVCDTILYKAVCNVLMPHVLQPLPESLTMVIKKFAKQLESWISDALCNLPESLRDMKLNMARKFSRILRLQMSLNHLCQASRSVVSSADIMSQMLDDWQAVDRSVIIKQTQLALSQKDMLLELTKINQFYDEFEMLLQDQGSIEAFIEWLDKIIEESIIKTNDNKTGSVKKKSQSFLLVWSAFSTKIIRDMTLQSAPSFGSFHLLHLMFDDYILYHLEHMCCSEVSDEILSDIKGIPKVSSISRESILPTSRSSEVDAKIYPPADLSTKSFVPSKKSNDTSVTKQNQQNEFITSSHVELLSQLTDSVSKPSSVCITALNSTTPVTAVTTSNSSRSMPADASDLPLITIPSSQQNVSYYMQDLDNADHTWRLQDATTPQTIHYHDSESYNIPTEQSSTDILYYAVNSMNLTPTVNPGQAPVASRVTFDPADAQEALNRSFEPFTQHMFDSSEKSQKRTAPEPINFPGKRFHEDGGGGEYEVRASDYVLS